MDSTELHDCRSFAADDRRPPFVVNQQPENTLLSTSGGRATRVLHLINGEHYSGAERVQDLLALQLPAFGFTVGFACLKPDKFPQARTAQHVPLFFTPMKSRLDLSAVHLLAKIIRQGDYQLLHAHTPRTLMLGACLKCCTQLPLVYHVHSPTRRDSTRTVQNWINTGIESIGIRLANRLLAVSGSLAQWLQTQGVNPAKVAVVRNGVPVATLRRSETPPGPEWTIGTVALFRPRKGIEVLIDSLALLRERGLNTRLHAVGPFETPEYEQKIKKQVEKCGLQDHVRWTGFTSDVWQELARIDLFALPSLFGEGLPMVVLEAMAAGVPVIGTLVEGVPEAIRDGLDGALAEPNDAVAFAAAIQRAITELDWVKMRASVIQRHAECFSDRAMAAGVAAAYRAIRQASPCETTGRH